MSVASLLRFYFVFYKLPYNGTCVILKFAPHRRVLRGYAALVYTLCTGINPFQPSDATWHHWAGKS
jgi:hypothetical protein